MEGNILSSRGRQNAWRFAIGSIFVLFLSVSQLLFVNRAAREVQIELRPIHNNVSTSVHISNSSNQEPADGEMRNISGASTTNDIGSSQEPVNGNISNISSANTTNNDIDKNIVIRLLWPKGDRLASNIDRPLWLMAYAHCYRQTFCIAEGKFSRPMKYFPGFVNQTCPKGLAQLGINGTSNDIFANPPLQKPGVYDFKDEDRSLINWMEHHSDCAFDDAMRQTWSKMITDAVSGDNPRAVNSTLLSQELFEKTDDPKVVTVAIQIRRGDYSSEGRKLILDQHFVILLRHLRSILDKAKRTPEVHLFSEDYGMIDAERNITRNWTMYEDLVDHYHLAPDMTEGHHGHSMDMDLNLRDWRHFLQADILVAASHFSFTPSLGRWKPPDPETGLPLTIHRYKPANKIIQAKDDVIFDFGWSKYDYGEMPDKYSLRNLPAAWAKYDTVPVETFMKDLMADWNATYNH